MTKVSATIVLTAALACAAGAYYWAHGLGASDRASRAAQPVPASPALAGDKPKPASAVAALSKTVEPGNHTAPAEAETPLRPGEVLEFSADVANLSNVANLRLQIVDRGDFFGKSAWHLQAFARTENPLRMVFPLDDQFDSYSDASTLSSLQYEMHLNERGEKQESIQRLTTTGTERATANVTQTRVAQGTRDPLGLMQYFRTVEWTKTHEVRGPVYDGHKLYDVSARLEGPAQNITVPAGRFSSSKIDIRVFDAGAELKDAHFELYLASDVARTPILLEAVMPFATARVALVRTK
jgi:Protein of unknown function (DUF3108)